MVNCVNKLIIINKHVIYNDGNKIYNLFFIFGHENSIKFHKKLPNLKKIVKFKHGNFNALEYV